MRRLPGGGELIGGIEDAMIDKESLEKNEKRGTKTSKNICNQLGKVTVVVNN